MENTEQSVDLDLLNNIMREPERERLSIILNELGVGLAGRGEDLNEVIRRANPALKEVDEVLRLLARQNDQLEQLAVDSDTIMEPLARERAHVSSAIENSSAVAEATAERRDDLAADIELLPEFLRELRPTMTRLGALSDEMTPVLLGPRRRRARHQPLPARAGPVLAGRHPGARLARRGVEDRDAGDHERAPDHPRPAARSPRPRGPSASGSPTCSCRSARTTASSA